MSDIYEKIKAEIEIRNTKIKDEFIPFLGLSMNGYYLKMSKKRLLLSELEKISEFFGVEMSYWFSDNSDYQNSGNSSVLNDPKVLYKKCVLCEEKQAHINSLLKQITTLEEFNSTVIAERDRLIKSITAANSEISTLKRQISKG